MKGRWAFGWLTVRFGTEGCWLEALRKILQNDLSQDFSERRDAKRLSSFVPNLQHYGNVSRTHRL